ncbi:cysteinyl leukotriene receptor 2 isoform X2 [Lepisosteus oculatus]
MNLSAPAGPCGGNQTCGNNDRFKFLSYTVTYSLVFPVGLLSNMAALYVFLRLTPKKSANTVFMINLALSDVGFSLTLPLRLVYYLRDGDWPFPDWLCRLCVFSFYVNLYTSVLFLTVLSVLRYVAVLHPMRNRVFLSARRAAGACVGIWAFVALSSTHFLFAGTYQCGGKTRCFEPRGSRSWHRILAMNYVALVAGFLLPFLTILGCYGLILRQLLWAGAKLRRSRRRSRRRSVQLISIIMSTFLCCFLPYHVLRTVHLHHRVGQRPDHPEDCALTELLQKVLVVTLCLAACNSCFNPLLYYFAGESFRTAARRGSARRSRGSFLSQSILLAGRHARSGSLPGSQKGSLPGSQKGPLPSNSVVWDCTEL